MRSIRSVETLRRSRLSRAVRRGRDVPAGLAAWAWVRPEDFTGAISVSLMRARISHSTASDGESRRARARSAGVRTITGFTLRIEQLLQATLREFDFAGRRFLRSLFERVEDQYAAGGADEIERAVDAGGVVDAD